MARHAPKCSSVGCFRDAVAKAPVSGKPLCQCCLRRIVGGNLRDYSSQPIRRIPSKALSVEIECFAPNQDSYIGATHVGFACSDGSLPNYGCEFKLVGHRDKMPSIAARFLNRLAPLRMQVNNKCGLHVGIDIRHLSEKRRIMLGQWLRMFQAKFFALVPRNRRTNRYCYPIPFCFNWEGAELNRINCNSSPSYPYRDATDRMSNTGDMHVTQWGTWREHCCVFNEAKAGRLECRLHPGSVNPHKVKAWLEVWRQLQTVFESDERFEANHETLCWLNVYQGYSRNTPITELPAQLQALPEPLSLLRGIAYEYWVTRRDAGGSLYVDPRSAELANAGSTEVGDD